LVLHSYLLDIVFGAGAGICLVQKRRARGEEN
jgi:hypothetical protein